MAAAVRRVAGGRTARIVAEAGALAVAGVVLAALLLIWRLAAGPVDVAALVPLLEEQLSRHHQAFNVRIGAARLEWAGWRHPVALRLDDVRAVNEGDGIIAGVPAMAVTLEPRALLRGDLAPVEITLYQPSLRLRRGAGGLDLRLESPVADATEAGAGADLLARTLAWLMAPPSDSEPMSRLERLIVRDARLVVEDAGLGVQWVVPASEMTIERADGGLRGDLAADLITSRDRADLVALGHYDRVRGRAEVAVAFGSLRPSAFADGSADRPGLDGLDLPMSGTVTLEIDAAGTIHGIGFDISAGAGRLDPRLLSLAGIDPAMLPVAPLSLAGLALNGHFQPAAGLWRIEALRLDLPLGDGFSVPGLAEPLRLSSLAGRGHLDTAAGELAWDDVVIDLGSDGEVVLPPPLDHRLPLRRIRSTGRWAIAEGRLDVALLQLALAGPQATVTGTVALDEGGAARVAAVARIDRVATGELFRYWPRTLAPGGHAWVSRRLSGGEASAGEVRLAARIGPDGITVDTVEGRFAIAGVDIDYLPPMPALRNMVGAATFDATSMTFTIAPAAGPGVAIEAATVVLRGLDGDAARAEVALTTTGTIADHLRLIDQPPLGFASAIGIPVGNVVGGARVGLSLVLPLEDDLRLGDVDIAARARLDDVRVAGLAGDRDLHDGRFDLTVDTAGLTLDGEARIGPVAGRIEARQTFAASDGVVRDIVATVTDAPVEDVQAVLLNGPPLSGRHLAGTVDARFHVAARAGGDGRIDARFDLADAAVDLPWLGWSKPRGAPGWADVVADMDGARLTAVPRFAASAAGLDIAAIARVGGAGGIDRIERIDVSRLRAGRTDLTGEVVADGGGGWTVAVRGHSLDLEPVLNRRGADDIGTDGSGAAALLPAAARVSVDIATVRLGEDRSLRRVQGLIGRDAGRWSSVELSGAVDDGQGGSGEVAMRATTAADGRRQIAATASDAGALLRATGAFANLHGGRLSLTAASGAGDAAAPLTGQLLITDYHVRRAPALAQVLGMLALTEIDNAFRGDGLSFDILDLPFSLAGDRLSIDGARAAGMSLGVTASGSVDLSASAIDLRGTVVPVYALNSALGNLPVVGFLFSGGERGGGLFAPTYVLSGSLADPQVIVNPVAALTPGVLRGVFDVFDGGGTLPDVGVAGGD